MQLFEGLLACGTLAPHEGHFGVTEAGVQHLKALGLEWPSTTTARRVAYPCLDWSERRDHLAGSLAVAMLEQGVSKGWLLRVKGSRALTLTPAGQAAWAPWLDQRPMRSVASKPGDPEVLRERQAL